MNRPPRSSSASASRIWARNLTRHEAWLALDLETTGLHPDAEIVDLALVGARGEVLFSSLVRPAGEVPPAARRVHGLDAPALSGAPAFAEVHGTLLRWMRGRVVVAYHAAFDRALLEAACRRADLPPPECEWECAWERYAAWRGFRASLGVACEVEQIDAPLRHRAAADALLVWELVWRMAGEQPPRSLTTELS